MNFAELDFTEEFAAAFDALENTSRHIFVTGKAGTGKSTLLQYFRHRSEKNVAVLAPTGVAAVNVKGQTIHSFFQFRPDITPQAIADLHVRRKKRDLYRKLEALIIDEISMVRADLLDCVDAFLRLYGPDTDKPFGGVQMVFFGDLFQLPPVVSRGEEDIFKTVYPTPFFFSAKVLEDLDFDVLELSKIYRQTDEGFIHLLNAVRTDTLEHHHLSALNTRVNAVKVFAPGDFYISLTSTNVLAERINAERLKGLDGRPHVYHGAIAGEFERKSLPTADILELKPGAQIMLLNNDPEKRWVNGSLGAIKAIRQEPAGEDVIVVCLENGAEVDVKKHTWEISQYYFNEDAQALASKVIGHFTQYPLKLAWAVTIHKSQGQTFSKVIIDIGYGTFAHGQLYVALSRCTTLDGIVLKQPLALRHVLLDPRVVDFHKAKIQTKAVLSFFLFFIFSSFVHAEPPAQEVAKALAKAETQVEFAKTWEGRHADKPYIALLSEYETTINPDWSFEETYHARVKIQKEAAKELGEWPITYNKAREEIVDVQAFVETPEGKRFPASNIQDLQVYDQAPLYSDMRVKMVTIPQVNIGSTIDVTVKTKTSRKEIPGQFWDEVPLPVIPTKLTQHTYVFPQDKTIAFKAVNTDEKPQVEKKDGLVKYVFLYKETGYIEDEELMPPADEVRGRLFLSSIPDWKTVADWYRALITKNTVPDPQITVKALELTKDKPTQKEKARAILEFIQDNFRYVAMNFGDHTVEPHPTNEVFKDRYGDCKDLSLLARTMLQLAGISSRICLFAHEFSGDPQSGLPNPSVFEHVILEILMDDGHYFVDPQAKGFDFGQGPSAYDRAHLLVIEEQGYRFDNMPVSKEEDNAIVSTSDITVHPDGSATFDVRVRMSLEGSQSFRETWASTTDQNKDKFFEHLEASFTQGGTMIKREVKGLENRYGPVHFNLKYIAPNAYPVANDMILLKESDQSDVPDFAEQKRVYPIFVASNTLVKNTNTYHVPEGYQVNFVPQDYQLGVDFMDVSADYRKDGQTVVVNSLTRMKRARVAPQRYGEVKALRNELYKKNDQYIVLKAVSQVSPEAKDWIKKQ